MGKSLTRGKWLRGMLVCAAPILLACLLLAVFFRARAESGADASLVVSKIGSARLDPPLKFPPGSQVRGIYLSPGDERNLDVQYMVVPSLGWRETYAYYQTLYAKARVKWFGLRVPPAEAPVKTRHYTFTLMRPGADRKSTATVGIDEFAEGPEGAAAGLSAEEQRRPIIYALVRYPDAFEKDGRLRRGVIIPIPSR